MTAEGPTLSVCFIVRDEEKYIIDALSSIEALADEIVVVDSGSQDKTLPLLREKQAANQKIKILERPWPNDFADQKNFAIAQATGKWILFLDADERVFENDHAKIKKALANAADIFAFEIEIRNYTRTFQQYGFQWNCDNDIAPGYYVTRLHRLFRKDERILYQGRLHERIEPSLESHHFVHAPLNIVIHHLGPLKEEDLALSQKRYEFYAQIGEQKVAENSSDPQARWELGVVYQKLRKPREALKLFEEALRLQPHQPEFEAYRAMTLFQLQMWDELLKIESPSREVEFFQQVALAQTDPEEIDRLSEFSELFVQAPLLQYELYLRHGLLDEARKRRDQVIERFGSTGWPQALEASVLRTKGALDEAKALALQAWNARCPLGLHELILCESQLKNFAGIADLDQQLRPPDRQALQKETLQLIEIAKKLTERPALQNSSLTR